MTAGTLKLLVEALYTGKVKLTGKSQLKNFEDALTCLNSFGILLNLRPVTLPRSTDYDEEEDEIVLDISFAPTEDKDEDLDEELRKLEEKFEVTEKDMIELDMESLLVEADVDAEPSETSPNLSVEDTSPTSTPAAATATPAVAASTPPTTRRRGRPSKADKSKVSETENDTTKVEIEASDMNEEPAEKISPTASSAKKRSRQDMEHTKDTTNAIPTLDESPKRRRRATDKTNTTKNEAKKPNFDGVTANMLNEKVKEGQRPFLEWLQTEGFLRKTTHCTVKDCQSKMELEFDKEDIDGCVWKCKASGSGKSKGCPTVSVRDGSIFGRVKKSASTGKSDSLSWIIQIILCWSDNTSLVQCQQLTGADVDKIFFWYDECRDYYGQIQ